MKGQPKLRGRPRKETGKRTKKIDARFTEEEYRLVLELEKQLGIRKTELVRMRLLHNAKNIVVNARDLVARLDAIGAEMGRAGNNINQLARYANTLRKQGMLSVTVTEHFDRLFDHYIRQQKELTVTLRQIIRQMGR